MAHTNDWCRADIDAERLSLDHPMATKWSEERWVRLVPKAWRMHRIVLSSVSGHAGERTSYEVLRDLLSDPEQNRTYLKPSVFHLAADAYQVGIFVIQWNPMACGSHTTYHHIRPTSTKHIVNVVCQPPLRDRLIQRRDHSSVIIPSSSTSSSSAPLTLRRPSRTTSTRASWPTALCLTVLSTRRRQRRLHHCGTTPPTARIPTYTPTPGGIPRVASIRLESVKVHL